MKNSVIFFVCLYFFIGPGLLFASDKEVSSMSYVGRDLQGAPRWKAESRITEERPGVYVMEERAEGIYSSFKGPVSWVARMEFERSEKNIRPIRMEKRVFDQKGRVIRVERQEFDLANNTATCTHEEPENKVSRTKKFTFDKDVVTRLFLGLYAQKFLESGKTSERLQMVSEEPNMYEIELKLLGKETIEVNGHPVTAYRLLIDPCLGAFNFVKVVIPKAYAWHVAGPEYEWLRYAGLEGGINSEKVEVTIVDYDKKAF